jgi:Cdc6-like AAA superfamily ATPase
MGKFNKEEADAEYKKLLEELTADKLTQTQFQKVVGKIEVLGELLIKYNEIH